MIMEKEITDKLTSFIKNDLKGNTIKLDSNTSLFKEGLLSSLDLVSLLDYIETEFNFTVPSEDVDFNNFDSVSAIARYLLTKNI